MKSKKHILFHYKETTHLSGEVSLWLKGTLKQR